MTIIITVYLILSALGTVAWIVFKKGAGRT
jgi:hypothetical protein